MLMHRITIFCLALSCLFFPTLEAYDLSGVNTSFNFGTVAPPFPDLTLTDSNVCVGYTVLVEPSNYHVIATSSSSSSTAFQLTNTTNSAYKLNYSVSWAGSTGGTPSFVALNSGQSSSSTFPAQLLGVLTCMLLPANATLRLQLLGSNQMLAKQGSYTDTLTILISAT